jgi:hypothetical protein
MQNHTSHTARLFRRALTFIAVSLGLLSTSPARAVAVATQETVSIGGSTVLSTSNFGTSATVSNQLTGQTIITGSVSGSAIRDGISFTLPAGKAVVSGTLAVTNYVAPVPGPGFPAGGNTVRFSSNSALNTTASVQTTTNVAVTAPTRCNTNTFTVSVEAPLDVRQEMTFVPGGPGGMMIMVPGPPMFYYGSASYVVTLEIGDQETSSALTNLTSSNTVLSPAFGAATLTYSANILNSQTSVTLAPTFGPLQYATASRNGAAATAINSGNNFFSMNVGANTVAIRVCAQDGTETVYNVNITRAPATAPTIVTNTDDSGVGSLEQAVLNANANAGADVITFDPAVFATAQTIALTSGLQLTGQITITGPAAGVTVQGPSNSEPFAVATGATANFTGLTIIGSGLCISNAGTLTASNCVFAGTGNGISNVHIATVTGCEFSASTNEGIYNADTGTLVVNDSTIRSAYSLSNSGTATMTGCTVITGLSEAALNNQGGGSLTLINCTALDMNGTYLFNNQGSGSTITAIHCTLIETAQSDNVGGATLTLKNSIFRTNTANTVFTDGGGNRVMNITGTLAADLTALGLAPTGLQDNGGPTLTIALLSGSAIDGGLAANVPVGLTTDQRGSGFDRSIGNPDSGAFEAAAPSGPTVGITTGGAVPGAPAGTTFAGATGLPGADEGDIGATNIKLPNGKTVKALVNSSGIIIKVGDALAGAGGAEIAKLDSMSFGVFQAELKLGTGSPAVTTATNKVVCFENGSGIQVLARSGQAAPGGSTFKSFRGSCGDAAGNVFIAGILNDGTSVDGGLWAIPAGGALTLLVKEGQMLDLGNGSKRVGAIASFPAGGKTQAEGRVHYGTDSIIARLTLGGDHVIATIPADATGIADWTVIARTNGDAPGAIGKYLTLGLPAAEGTNVVFTAVLKTTGAVTAANNKIVVAGGAVIARKGDAAAGTSGTFVTFEDVAAGTTGQASFTANISGATTATDSGLWEYRSSALSLVARQGDAAPDLSGVTIVGISRFVQPGGGLGPVFVATLGGASAPTNVALFGVPSTGGSALNLARKGDQFDINGTMRTLTSINALKMDLGNEGVARGYTDTNVFMIGGFGTRTALIEFPVAP